MMSTSISTQDGPVEELGVGEVIGSQKVLGWQRIVSEGHVWVARMNDQVKARTDFTRSSNKLKAMLLLAGSVALFSLTSVAQSFLSSPEAPASAQEVFGEPFRVGFTTQRVIEMNMGQSNEATLITSEILLSKDPNGRLIMNAIVEDYLAGNYNQNDFVDLTDFSQGWPSGKVGVVKTDKATWFGIRFKTSEMARNDASLILAVPKEGKEAFVVHPGTRMIESAGLPRLELQKIPREAVEAGLAEKM